MLLRKLLAGIAVAAIVLMGAELALRLLLGPPPPPVTVHQVKGDVERYLDITDGMVTTTYQVESPIDPFPLAASGPRVAVLGGSSVRVGSNRVAVQQEFASLLAHRLDVPVLNLGSPGLDSFDLVSLTEELDAVPLDLLIVYSGHNDLGNVMFQQRYGDLVGGTSATVLPVLERLQLFSQLRRMLTGPVGTEHPDQPGLIRRDRNLRPSTAQRQTAERFFAANLQRIVWRCQQRGLPLIVVVPASDLLAPPARDCTPGAPCARALWQRGAQAISTGHVEDGAVLLRQARDIDPVSIRASSGIEATVRSLAEEDGVVVVDAAADLPRAQRALVPGRTLFADAIHFSAAGHGAMADLLEAPSRALLPSP